MTFPDHSSAPDQVCCYNVDHARTPGQMKVRWKIRIATETEARRLDTLQQQAIINLLTWADSQRRPHQEAVGIKTEIPGSNSVEHIPEYVQWA